MRNAKHSDDGVDIILSAKRAGINIGFMSHRDTTGKQIKRLAPGFCYPDGTGSIRMDGWM